MKHPKLIELEFAVLLFLVGGSIVYTTFLALFAALG